MKPAFRNAPITPLETNFGCRNCSFMWTMRFHCPEISSIILLYAIAVVAILIKQMLVSYVGCFINIAKIIRHRGNKKSSCKRVSKIFNFRSSVLKPKKYITHFTISERSYYRFFFSISFTFWNPLIYFPFIAGFILCNKN